MIVCTSVVHLLILRKLIIIILLSTLIYLIYGQIIKWKSILKIIGQNISLLHP